MQLCSRENALLHFLQGQRDETVAAKTIIASNVTPESARLAWRLASAPATDKSGLDRRKSALVGSFDSHVGLLA